MGSSESSVNNLIISSGYIDSKVFRPVKNDISELQKLYKENMTIIKNWIPVYTENGKYKNQIFIVTVVPICLKDIPLGNIKCVIFSYGNNSTIVNSFEFACRLAEENRICVILYDYIGYGFSTGDPSEVGCTLSLSAVIKFVTSKNKIIDRNIILMGHSLGTGVIINLLYENYWDSPIILISPFKSILSTTVPFDKTESTYFSSDGTAVDKFVSSNKISKLVCPIKIFHGKNDTIIDVSHSLLLYKKVKNKKYPLTIFNNVGHNDILNELNSDDFHDIFS